MSNPISQTILRRFDIFPDSWVYNNTMTRDHISKQQYSPYFASQAYEESEERAMEVCIETWFDTRVSIVKKFFTKSRRFLAGKISNLISKIPYIR